MKNDVPFIDVTNTPAKEEMEYMLPPTPGNNFENLIPNQEIEDSEFDEIPWFSPTYVEHELAPTPGRNSFDRYSPPSHNEDIESNSDDGVETPQSSNPIDFDEMEETFRTTFGAFDTTVDIRQPSPTKNSTSTRNGRGWFTIDVDESRCHDFCGHIGFQRTITYRFWVSQKYPKTEVPIEGCCQSSQKNDISPSSNTSWIEVSPLPTNTCNQFECLTTLSKTTSEQTSRATPYISLFAFPDMFSINLSSKSSTKSDSTYILYFTPKQSPLINTDKLTSTNQPIIEKPSLLSSTKSSSSSSSSTSSSSPSSSSPSSSSTSSSSSSFSSSSPPSSSTKSSPSPSLPTQPPATSPSSYTPTSTTPNIRKDDSYENTTSQSLVSEEEPSTLLNKLSVFEKIEGLEEVPQELQDKLAELHCTRKAVCAQLSLR
ncbi:flocculation protein FLO11-like [Lucilia sericata]|uniref:flocculation protein FLO11-like n=1 Tax=Lucilia sericata TaxID=13632 RepID=UPI0018A86C56|nr:flocculation protein FLO11-like [Lucilia sericata]